MGWFSKTKQFVEELASKLMSKLGGTDVTSRPDANASTKAERIAATYNGGASYKQHPAGMASLRSKWDASAGSSKATGQSDLAAATEAALFGKIAQRQQSVLEDASMRTTSRTAGSKLALPRLSTQHQALSEGSAAQKATSMLSSLNVNLPGITTTHMAGPNGPHGGPKEKSALDGSQSSLRRGAAAAGAQQVEGFGRRSRPPLRTAAASSAANNDEGKQVTGGQMPETAATTGINLPRLGEARRQGQAAAPHNWRSVLAGRGKKPASQPADE